ncbi:hypothetical protein HUB97_12475 [Halorubraceae archaeon YAN]|nr:hypothetical protein [Halorubraceae archaeon YAN]
MDRSRFVTLALASFGLIFLSFIIRGTTRIFLPYSISLALAAPVVLLAFGLMCYLFVWGVLDITGIRSID